MFGIEATVQTDSQLSCRPHLQNVSSIPSLDMTFQSSQAPPGLPTGKHVFGYESMESMDNGLNSGKTTPMNYMRGSAAPVGVVRGNKSIPSESEEDGLGNLLRSSITNYYEHSAEDLDAETFGDVQCRKSREVSPEPWEKLSSATSKDTHSHQSRNLLPTQPILSQFEHLNVSSNSFIHQSGLLDGSGHNSGLVSPRSFGEERENYSYQVQALQPPSLHLALSPRNVYQQHQPLEVHHLNHQPVQHQQQQPRQQPRQQQFQTALHLSHNQEHFQGQCYPQQYQYQAQGQYQGQSQGQGNPSTGNQYGHGQQPQQQRTAVGPDGYYYGGHAQAQSAARQVQVQVPPAPARRFSQGQGQGQYGQSPPQQHAPQPVQHQYNHGSYASAPQTPLSVLRMQAQTQGGSIHQQSQPHSQSHGYGQQTLRSPSHSSDEDAHERSVLGRDYAVGQIQDQMQQGHGQGMSGHQQQQQFSATPLQGPAVRLPPKIIASTSSSSSNHYGQPVMPMAMPMQQQQAYPATARGGPSVNMNMQQELVYQVQFKRGVRAFTLSARAAIMAVNERDFVVVEADRGEDIGIVVEILSMHAFLERRMNAMRPAQPAEQEDQNVGCILRLATLHERQQLPDKFHTEKDVVQSCNDLAQHGFGLPITVFEAEFQFDRRKLTIFYDCSVRIDFRDFVRQLYSTYKARIWMKKVSVQAVPDVQPFAAMALATGVQFSAGSSA